LRPDLSGLALDLAHWGVADPTASSPFSIRRRAPALTEAKRCSRSLARSIATAASPRKDDACVGCRCRHGSPAWWSTRERTQRLAADIALVLTERGLGGNDVDLGASRR
jgi:ATP-dependent helicase HrpB